MVEDGYYWAAARRRVTISEQKDNESDSCLYCCRIKVAKMTDSNLANKISPANIILNSFLKFLYRSTRYLTFFAENGDVLADVDSRRRVNRDLKLPKYPLLRDVLGDLRATFAADLARKPFFDVIIPFWGVWVTGALQ